MVINQEYVAHDGAVQVRVHFYLFLFRKRYMHMRQYAPHYLCAQVFHANPRFDGVNLLRKKQVTNLSADEVHKCTRFVYMPAWLRLQIVYAHLIGAYSTVYLNFLFILRLTVCSQKQLLGTLHTDIHFFLHVHYSGKTFNTRTKKFVKDINFPSEGYYRFVCHVEGGDTLVLYNELIDLHKKKQPQRLPWVRCVCVLCCVVV